MPRIDDYQCPCGTRFEHTRMTTDEQVPCPSCGRTDTEALVGSHPVTVIVPMHRRSLTRKAGFVHTHGDRPAERGSVSVPANKGSF
jgi:putative FmdB family regulatory protein